MTLTRYLLSHNHDISDEVAPALSREVFVAMFQEAIASKSQYSEIQVSRVEHPHWQCELKTTLPPEQMGTFLAEAVKTYRERTLENPLNYKVLILGGLKTTPATSASPAALQLNEWGVDIAETMDDEAFLSKINWAGLTGHRPTEEIIQVIV